MSKMKTIDEIRRKNLGLAIKRVRTAAKLAELTGTAAAYLSQIKNSTPDSKTGTPKTMGDDVARRIEDAIGESTGWMDRDHSHEGAEVPMETVSGAGVTWTAPNPGMQLITDAEYRLLDYFRRTDDEGKGSMMRFAEKLPMRVLHTATHNKR